MKIIGATHLRNFDIFGDNMKKMSQTSRNDRNVANLEKAHKRLERLKATCKNPSALSWYSSKFDEVDQKLVAVYSVAHDVEDSGSEESGYRSSDVEDLTPTEIIPNGGDRHTTSVANATNMELTPHTNNDIEAEVARAAPMLQ